MQLGFPSNITLDIVTLPNFFKNHCGRLYFDSLVAKPLSDMYYDSSSNFQTNDWQKVQYNTQRQLFIQSKMALIANQMAKWDG